MEDLPEQKPGTVDELSDVVRQAARSDQALLLRGGRTHERFANHGSEIGSVLDLTGLDNVVDYSPVDLTVAVQAGVTLEAIEHLLATEGQRLAVDVPHRAEATIGGTFASGLSGPRRLRYGSLKDQVIGVEIVNDRGERTSSGGMVVKNVSGYELARLHYGAHGAFGVIARLNLKVLPTVESRVEVRASFGSAREAFASAEALLRSTFDPSALYLLKAPAEDWVLHIQLEGSAAFTNVQSKRVIESLDGVEDWILAPLERPSTPSFDNIAELKAKDFAVARLSVAATEQAVIVGQLGDFGLAHMMADVGSGLLYIRTADATHLLETVGRLGVAASFLALPDGVAVGIDVFGAPDMNSMKVLRHLKDQYDPARMFNPGRFVGFL